MAVYAIISAGVVTNTIEWDGVAQWLPPTATLVIEIPLNAYVGIGSAYSNGSFTPPPAPPQESL